MRDQDSIFAAFLADVLCRIDRGEPIDREQLLADHEHLRPQLESFFKGDSLVAQLLHQTGIATNGDACRVGQDSRVGRVREAHAHELPTRGLPGRFADFDLLAEIGRGGMGVVYKARQLRPDRIVALKMVLAGRHASPTALARFRTEAEAAARLRHPSIIPIHQVGEHDGLAYYVMDYIQGESLDARLARGPLAPRVAAEMLLEVTRAVAHAHQHGVIHRDLKTANILIEMRNSECGVQKTSLPLGEGRVKATPHSELRTPNSLLTPHSELRTPHSTSPTSASPAASTSTTSSPPPARSSARPATWRLSRRVSSRPGAPGR